MALSRDAGLLGRVRRDDDAAFERLHGRHQAAVLAFCRHLTGSREDAEDAVQHTFLAAYRRIADGERTTDWRPWLFTVARNRCLTLIRARRGESPLIDEELVAAVDGLAVEVERRQELRDVVADMALLPEPQRAALVLSQLDALDYREIATVLGVTPQKVKALVFQGRSSLTSAREAREASCVEIRQQIATARGSALRRRLLRRHVGQCDGCREFEVAVKRQREDFAILLPVVPAAGLGQSILGAVDRETVATGGAAVAGGGGASVGLGGALTAIGLPGAAKLAVVAAVVGGGASGALAADLPGRVQHAVAGGGAAAGELRAESGVDEGAGGSPDRGASGGDGLGGPERAGGRAERDAGGDERRTEKGAPAGGPGGRLGAGDERPGRVADGDGGGDQGAPGGGEAGGLPPGLAKRDELPPGLAKREKLPPGLAKRDELPPGLAKRRGGGPAKGHANGQGNGNDQANGRANGQGNGNGQAKGHANGQGAGGGQQGGGNGAAGGSQGVANGNGQGNGVGQGNGNGGGVGNGGAGGSKGSGGNGQSNGGGQGNAGQGPGSNQGNGGGNGVGQVGAGQGNGTSGNGKPR
jgi:RNA polymerase sigma factor (sigma-70 family)